MIVPVIVTWSKTFSQTTGVTTVTTEYLGLHVNLKGLCHGFLASL